MDDYEKTYKSVCRVCLRQSDFKNMVSLTDNTGDNGLSCFGKSISILTNISFEKDDKLPNMMCQYCVYLLKQAVHFKLQCESSDQKLKLLMTACVNNKDSEQNFKEIVCQYVMFHHYFPSETNAKLLNNTYEKTYDTKLNGLCQVKKEIKKNDVNIQKYEFSYEFEEGNNDSIDCETAEFNTKIDTMLDKIQDLINSESLIPTHKMTKRQLKQKMRQQNCYPSSQRKPYKYMCNICHRLLANHATYDHHMQRHSKCRYICDQCGKGFPVLAEMHMHQIARHGIGPYLQCEHCPYKAPRKLSLIEHLRLHTGERPFSCDKCGLTFRRKAIWRNHLICHMEKKLQCAYCPMKFYRNSQLLAHCNNVHQRMYMYVCHICNVNYTKTETVRRHMLLKHGIPREQQGKIVKITNGNNLSPTFQP